MSKIDQAARRVAEAEDAERFAAEAARKAQSVANDAFESLQEAHQELGAAVREQVEKAREYVNGADTASEAPEEGSEKLCVDLGEIQLMPPVPTIEIRVINGQDDGVASEVIDDLIDWAEGKVRSTEEGSVNNSLYCHVARTIEQKAKEAGIR